jgi:cell filamentation protein
MADLWRVHPFREGNTRTTITFVCQYAESRGIQIDRQLFENNAAYTRNALVAASAVFADGDFRKPEYLYRIVRDALDRGSKH